MSNKAALLKELQIDRSIDTPSSNRRAGAFAGLLAAASALCIFGWYTLPRDHAVAVHTVFARPVAAASEGAGSASILDASGYVVARRWATVSSKVVGRIADNLVEEGRRVEAGQIICHLDDSNARVALAEAKASLQQALLAEADARPIFERSMKMFHAGLISKDTFEAAKATFDNARSAAALQRANLAVAQQNEDDAIVRAPFSGVVTAKTAQPGEIVSPIASSGFTRTGIATIVDMSSLEIEVDVSEDFITRVHPKQPAAVTLNAYPGWQIPAEVVAVIPTADRSKATVKVRVRFLRPDPRILPEMGARVAFMTDSSATAAAKRPVPSGVLVPVAALSGQGTHASVFVVHDDHAEERLVTLGARAADEQVVLTGLAAGERVIADGSGQIHDGVKIQMIPE